MPDRRPQRRLAAILLADVVGYSRLMGEDEVGTFAQVRSLRRELLEPKIEEYDGRIVKTMGDGFLIEFPSAVDAVGAAVAVQRAILQRNASVPEDRRIEFRIGINVGDVIVDNDDIYGDGVNIAARLETLADPGAIFVSQSVRDPVQGKLDATFEDLGEHEVKNIAEPVRVYRVEANQSPTATSSDASGQLDALLQRPAVAVLPFTNMSGDPEQEYFADGLTDDIITALSYWRSFPVIARNSTFSYKGQSPDVRCVASDARYVLEGSVRRGGTRVRITAQLIDAATGHHVWAEKYDRPLDDIFDVQDDLTSRISAVVEPELRRAEERQSTARKRGTYHAWDYCQRGRSLLGQRSKDGIQQARTFLEQAIDLDPSYGQAYAELAWTYHAELLWQRVDNRQDCIEKLLDTARKAVQVDELDSFAHTVLAYAHRWCRKHDLAIAEAETAVELNPSNANAIGTLGSVLDLAGRSEEGAELAEKSLALNPRDSRLGGGSGVVVVARCHLNARHYEDAVSWSRRAVKLPLVDARAYAILAIALAHLGRIKEAEEAFRECERYRPGFAARWSLLREYRNEADNEHITNGLRKAGWAGPRGT